jgi:hypothetical protein
MAKKRLKDIAEEFNIDFEEAQKIVYHNLDEDMVSGKGKNTWISEAGQDIFDNYVPLPVIYRGKVVRLAPNPMFVVTYIKELGKTVPVKLRNRNQKGFLLKTIYVKADNSGAEPRFSYIRPQDL